MCPKPFSWEKKKRKRAFFDGKLRGSFLARVALKSYWKKKYMQINLLDVDIQKGELGSLFSNSLTAFVVFSLLVSESFISNELQAHNELSLS